MIRQLLISITAASFVCSLSLCAVADAGAAELHIGRSSTVITPNEQTGGVKPVLDDLHAKALVLQQGDTAAAIIALDLPVVSRDVVLAIRKRIAEHSPIPVKNIMISATHTHTGLMPGWAGNSSFPALFPPKDGPQREKADCYRRFLIETTVAAVVQAVDDLQPARVLAAVGHEDSLSAESPRCAAATNHTLKRLHRQTHISLG